MTGMMVMQVVPKRWDQNSNAVGTTLASSSTDLGGLGKYTGKSYIRRPTRGIVLKEDTFATLRVVTGSGQSRWLIDAGSRRDDPVQKPQDLQNFSATDVYSNFLVQSVSEERVEKQQILETFGEAYIFFFGERARILNISGVLMNSWDFNWEAEWWENYERELRGTRCVENDARVFLQFDNTLIGGYILASSAQKNAQERNWVNFSFQMFVTSYANLTNPETGKPDANPGVNYSFITQNIQGSPSSTTLAPMRPVLVSSDPTYDATGATIYGQDLSLADQLVNAWSDGLKAVSAAWDSVDNALYQATTLAGQFINGDDIRVPVGFQGALAFDDEADVSAITVQYGGSIGYTTFADNDDEFVNSGDQYASAGNSGNMAWAGLGVLGTDDVLESSAEQLSEAQAEWAAAGLPVPDVELGAISQVLHATVQTGLVVATGVQNWSAYLNSGNGGSASGPFAAVLKP